MAIPDQTYTYVWDGKDVYGRTLFGAQPATVRVGYVYDAVYYDTITTFENSFNQYGGAPISAQRALNEITLWQEIDGKVGDYDARMQGLGGWSLDMHHTYDVNTRTLFKGDGSRRTAEKLPDIVVTVAGTGVIGSTGLGGPAIQAEVGAMGSLAVGPNGSVYIAETGNNRVTKIDTDGNLVLVAGVGTPGLSGDGGSALLAELNNPTGVAVGSDGSVYIADNQNNRIRRVYPSGIITTVVGSGPTGYLGQGASAGDGGLAINAQLSGPLRVLVSSDGTLFISDSNDSLIRRVTTDGYIETYYAWQSSGRISGLALGTNGELYASISSAGN